MAGTGYAGSDEYKWANCVSGTGWTYAVAEETLLCEIERKTILGSHGLLDASNEWGNKMVDKDPLAKKKRFSSMLEEL